MEQKQAPQELQFAKEELKDLHSLLRRSEFIDDEEIWISGYRNLRKERTSNELNVLSLIRRKKDMKFLAKNGDNFYLMAIDEDKIVCYKAFVKDDVSSIKTGTGLLCKTIKIQFKDGFKFIIDVKANKDNTKQFKTLLK